MNASNTLWGIHAGRTGEADAVFLKENVVAIGWHEVGDLGALAPDRDAFKARVAACYPRAKAGAIPNYAGQLFRFVHEIKPGDLVVYPSKAQRRIHIGEIVGDYRYAAGDGTGYPNRRAVRWLREFPRTHFSQGALYEIGSAMSLFQVRNHADEFRRALQGQTPAALPAIPLDEDETVAAVAAEIEESTRDFVLKRLAQELKGEPLEGFVVHLLQCMGYQARQTRKNEPSVDVIAHKDPLGLEPPIIKVQVKSSTDTATHKDVSALFGTLSQGEYGLFITLGSYSPHSRSYEQSKANLRLIDGVELADLVFAHYEQFDARHKGLLPLRRVYVPEALDED